MLVKIRSDPNSHKLLERMQNGIALWKSLAVSYNDIHGLTTHHNSIFRYLLFSPEENIYPLKDLFTNIQGTSIHCSPKP